MESRNLPSATGDTAAPSPALEDDSASNPIIARWASDIRALPDEHRERFLKEMPEGDLHKFANAIEEVITQRIKSSRTLQAGQWIAPLGQLVEMAKPFAGTIESAFPPTGLILGGISVFLTVAKSFVDYQESMIRLLQKVLVNLNVLEKFKSTIPKTQEIQLVLVTIYGDLVKFLAKAVRPFLDKKGRNRASLVSMAKSMWKPFNAEFGVLEKHLDDHLAAFHLALSLHSQKEQYKGSKLQQRTFGMLKNTEQRRTLLEKESGVKETTKEREELRREILDWIPHISFDHIQDDKHSNSLSTTGGWLFDHEAFRSWKNGGPSNLLWITGKAGSGKSHLAAHIIHNIRESCRGYGTPLTDDQGGKDHALAFVYCSSKTNTSKLSADVPAISTLLGSILRQLYAQLPKDKNVEAIRGRYKESKYDHLRRAEIKDSIRSIFREFPRAYIVVDGLDEYLGMLLSVALFSPAIEIQVDDGSNINDIKTFVNERTVDLAKNPLMLQQIQKALLDEADGVFLWVSLTIKIIEMEVSDKAKMAAAKNTWRGLAELYSEMLQRILAQPSSRRDLGLKALLWVANSQEPLTKKELVHALSFKPGMEALDSDDIIDESIILSSCADILVEKHDQYELVHFSLSEFLRSDVALEVMHSNHPRGKDDEPHALLASTCMSYLLLDKFKEGPVETKAGFEDLIGSYPLLRHAALHWGTYLRLSMSPKNTNFARDILQNLKARNLAMQALDFYSKRGHNNTFPWPGSVHILHVIAIFGLEEFIEYVPEAVSQIDLPDGFSWYPIDYAVIKKQESMARWLLCHGGTLEPKPIGCMVNDNDFGLVSEAAYNGWVDVVSDLIAAGADKDKRDGDFETAWHQAAYYGYMDIADILAKSGADPNLRDRHGQTPLMMAAASSDTKMLKRLPDCGADVNLQDNDGDTALHSLANRGKNDEAVEMISLLCDNGANTELENDIGNTPLVQTTSCDNITALKSLMSKGATLTAKNQLGSSVLHLASLYSCTQVMRFLFNSRDMDETELTAIACNNDDCDATPDSSPECQHSQCQVVDLASLNCANIHGRWPLHGAARYGEVEYAQYLCNFDPDQVHREDEDGYTPLHVAVFFKKSAMVDFLLDRGAHINAMTKDPSDDQLTPLHVAMRGGPDGGSDMVAALLTKGADPYLKNREGRSAWDYVSIYGTRSTAQQILDKIPEIQDDKTRLQESMQQAIGHQNVEVVSLLLSLLLSKYEKLDLPSRKEIGRGCGRMAAIGGSFECWKMLVSLESLPAGEIGPDNGTALHLAAIHGRVFLINALSGMHFNLDQTCSDNRSPLILAAQSMMLDVVRVLCEKGVNVNHADSYGRTALHYTAGFGCRKAVKVLLNAGADVNIPDFAGFTAADYANSSVSALLGPQSEGRRLSQSPSDVEKAKEAISTLIRKLRAQHPSDQPDTEGYRDLDLATLHSLLLKLRLFREAILSSRATAEEESFTCDVCGCSIEGSWYHCTECLGIDLCLSCHHTFVGKHPGGQRKLNALEDEMRPVRKALQHVSQFGINTLLHVLDSVEVFWIYFKEKEEQYCSWQERYDLKEKQLNTPGWELTCIAKDLEALREAGRNEGDAVTTNTIQAVEGYKERRFTYMLRWLFRYRSPAREQPPVDCYSHKSLKVPSLEEFSAEDRAYFGKDGALIDTFFESLKERIANFEVVQDVTDYKAVRQLGQNRADSPISGEASSGINVETQLPDTLNPDEASPPSNDQCQTGIDEDNSSTAPDTSSAFIDIDEVQKTLLQKMSTLQPDEYSLARGDGMVLETAWSLAQAIVYGDEERLPSLVELMRESGE
ncbi:hypothetical protein PG989_016477 [Apiospora arundinis]